MKFLSIVGDYILMDQIRNTEIIRESSTFNSDCTIENNKQSEIRWTPEDSNSADGRTAMASLIPRSTIFPFHFHINSFSILS